MDTILACDLGTSAIKLSAIVLFPAISTDRIVATATRAYPTRYAVGGHAEQDPDDWLQAFVEAVRELVSGGRLAGICGLVFTGQMSAALPVDASGRHLHAALIWSDQRAVDEAARAAQRLEEGDFYAITGNRLNATYTGPKLAWLLRNRPEVWAKTATFLQPKDWLIAQLTGQLAMDPSDASCTGLFDLAAGIWSERLFDLFEISLALAPEIIEASAKIGALKPDMAQLLRLPAGLPVVLGGGDGPTTALGAGIGPGQAYLSLGTSAWISLLADAPLIDPRQRLFSFRHVLPGHYAITGSTQNAGGALGWLMGDILQSSDPSKEIAAALTATEPGADGLLVRPYLQGERTPLWDSAATGAIFGLRSHHTRAHLIRAFVEGIGHQLRLVIETFGDCGCSIAELKMVGGLTGNAGIMATFAMLLQRELHRPEAYAQVTALGAGMIGALAIGALTDLDDAKDWVGSDTVYTVPETHAALERAFASYRTLHDQALERHPA